MNAHMPFPSEPNRANECTIGCPPSWFDVAGVVLTSMEELVAETERLVYRVGPSGSLVYLNDRDATKVALALITAFPGRFLWIVFLDGRYPILITPVDA